MTRYMLHLPLNQPEYFLDEIRVAAAHRIERVLHAPELLGRPVVSADRPWEANMVTLHGTVLFDPERGQYRMWYQSIGKDAGGRFRDTFVCLAESQDAMHWSKPSLGIHDYEGQATNIVLTPPAGAEFIESASVVHEPEEPSAARRYKMLLYVHYREDPEKRSKSGLYAAFSPDGVRWTWHGERVSDMGDRGNLCPVKIAGRYVYYGRARGMMDRTLRRTCWMSRSGDFTTWDEPELVLQPDVTDPVEREFYAMGGFPLGGQYLGWLQRLDVHHDILDMELIASRDGAGWHRLLPGRPFLTPGQAPWCKTWLDLPSNAPLEVNGEWYWFVAGRTGSHALRAPHPYGAIGLATQKKDHLVSVTARRWPGRLETAAFTGEGRTLEVLWEPQLWKFDLAGELRVSLLDALGAALAGYQDGVPGEPDKDGWRPIRWSEPEANLGRLTGRPLRVRFDLRDSHLFAYRVTAR